VTVLPPTGPLLIAIAGLALAGRHPLRGRMIASVGVFLVLLLSMPATSAFLVRCLDRSPPFEISRATDAQAIVILGGGTRPYAAEYGGATLGSITLERVRYGAQLARASGLPILVSGGLVAWSAAGGAADAQCPDSRIRRAGPMDGGALAQHARKCGPVGRFIEGRRRGQGDSCGPQL
jgi:Uncharacterized conserved protein